MGDNPASTTDATGVYNNDGTINWQKREEKEYHHAYDYLGGFLGQDTVEEEMKKKQLKGKYEDLRLKNDPRTLK